MMKENLLKKILLFSTVGMALTGCVSETHVSTEESNKQITFEVAKYKPTTRVMAIIPIDEFGTFAYKKKNGEGEVHATFMDNIKIKYYSAGYWAAENENAYMWEANSHIDFISYAPYNSDKTSSVVPKISDNGSGSKNQLKYEGVTVDESKQVDLLYSDKAVCQTYNTTGGYTGVPTLFRHALAKLNFKFTVSCTSNFGVVGNTDALRYWQVKVTSIKIENIYKKGDVTLLLEDDSHNSMTTKKWNNQNTTNNVWTPVTEGEDVTCSKEWTVEGGQEALSSLQTFGSENNKAENYYVLPQVLEDGKQKITVKYKVFTGPAYDGPWTAAGGERTGEMYFRNLTAVAAWEMGKNITYTIVIDPTKEAIHFAPSVEGWESTGTGTSGDIKF